MTVSIHDPIEVALLARLLVRARKAPSEAEVLRSLCPLFAGANEARALAQLRTTLARLESEGLRTNEMTLTAKGKKHAAALLGLGSAKVPPHWRALKALLVQIALGRPARKPLTSGAIRAAALATKLGIDTTTASPSDVLDAWAAREMGMDGKRLTIANVRAHVLSRALGIDTLRDPKRIGAVATAKVLGVPRTDAGTVQDAVLRDWLRGAKPTESAKAARPSPPPNDLNAFASAVRELARDTTDGRFGRHKVFIGPIWNRARSASTFAPMNEGEFKSKLVDAHRAGLLRLSRADLTPAMAPELVAASEVPYLNAVFHFVDLEGTLS